MLIAPLPIPTLQDALPVLEGRAFFDSPEHEVHTRLAKHEGAIYLDLANPDRSVVRIGSEGWELIQNAPVKFRRPRGLMALPIPAARGGAIGELRQHVNVREDDFPLLEGWIAGAMCPNGPYPVLT